MPSIMDKKTITLAHFIDKNKKRAINNLLVVGCGSGIEAAVLAKELKVPVIGIDIVDKFDTHAAQIATLKKGDAMNMGFENGSFDFVYSFHALEHIKKPELAIKEILRVLKDDGGYIIGTPNRKRLVGYLGSACSMKEKIFWNLVDWHKKIINKFRNELGAHAGFTSQELYGLLIKSFNKSQNITKPYYMDLYASFIYQPLLKLIYFTKLENALFPSIYFMGFKK